MNPGQQPSSYRFLRWMIFLFTAIIGIETGAAIFTSVVVFPVWTASAEAAIGWVPSMPYYMEEGDFFMYASSMTMLTSILTLFAAWRAPQPFRRWLMIATISFIIVFIWSALYFIPIQDTTFKGKAGTVLPPAELEARMKLFANLNYIRVLMLLISFGLGLCALSKVEWLRPKGVLY